MANIDLKIEEEKLLNQLVKERRKQFIANVAKYVGFGRQRATIHGRPAQPTADAEPARQR